MKTGQYQSEFRRRFFKTATAAEWNDWRWQLSQAARTAGALARWISFSPLRRSAAAPVRVTPYYASLLSGAGAPLRRTVIPPVMARAPAGERPDPLGEEKHSPVPGIVHTYPDKVLLLATDQCFLFCQFCTRGRLLGRCPALAQRATWERALEYIARRKAVRDVLISGGDPLLLPDDRLDWLLRRLRRIPHVDFVRIGTKAPAALPQRITPALASLLRRRGQPWLSLHFTHPAELTAEARAACARLADQGLVLGSQTVLLRGVNDSIGVLRRLMHGLLQMRARPYYLHQCDAITGAAHFKTPVRRGLKLVRQLHGYTTGYAVPVYALDAPGGGGKVPLSPAYYTLASGGRVVLRNYRGRRYEYLEA